MSSLTEEHERDAREIESKYKSKLRTQQAQNDLRRKTELHELEEQKNRQVHTLMRNHEKAFSDIKNYYNDITANNMALINTLKVGAVGAVVLLKGYLNWGLYGDNAGYSYAYPISHPRKIHPNSVPTLLIWAEIHTPARLCVQGAAKKIYPKIF